MASGVLSVTPALGSTINFTTAGLSCNGPQLGTMLYTGAFSIAPSTGGFSSAVGSGNMTLGADFFSDVGIFDLVGVGTGLN